MSPLVTLTTDFGLRDAYVAELKGALLRDGPTSLRLVDLSHELPAFDVHGAALFVRSAVPAFPRGTVHVVVVDPGVGSARRPIIARVDDQLLVGPDNKVFGYLFNGREEVFEIDPRQLGPQPISKTFHGRDIFAPAAARLAAGVAPEALGKPIDGYEHLVFPLVEYSGDTLVGRVIHVDRFGNLITNITAQELAVFCAEFDAVRPKITLGETLVGGLVDHYAQVAPGELLALVGSGGLLEVAVREGSAADKLAAGRGRHVRVHRSG